MEYGYDWVVDNSTSRSVLAMALLCLCVIPLIYSVALHGLYGQTLGKRLCGVVVLDVTESPLSMWQAVLRDSPCIVATLIFLPVCMYRVWQGVDAFGADQFSLAELALFYTLIAWTIAEFITMFSNPMRRAVHDYLAGSVVVRNDEIGPSAFFT